LHPAVVRRLKFSAAILAVAFFIAFTLSFTASFWSQQDTPKDYVSGTADRLQEVATPKLDIPVASSPVPAPMPPSVSAVPAPSTQWLMEAPVTPRYDQPASKASGVGMGATMGIPDLGGALGKTELPLAPQPPQAAGTPQITLKPLFGTSAGGLTSGDTLSGATGTVTGGAGALPSAGSLLRR